jgi:hypothetical protein
MSMSKTELKEEIMKVSMDSFDAGAEAFRQCLIEAFEEIKDKHPVIRVPDVIEILKTVDLPK